MNSMRTANAWVARRSRGGLLVVALAMIAACADATGPAPRVVGDVFIVPYHSWGERERAAVRRHYAAARGATVDHTWSEFVADWRPVDPYGITTLDASAMLRTAAGRAEIMARVRDAIAAGQLLDLMFHDIPAGDVGAFHALVEELAGVRHRVFTWADLYPVDQGA
jgi:hypothetical protein